VVSTNSNTAKTLQSQNQARVKRINLEGRDEDLVVTLQKVEHPSRVHIDIETDDIDAEVKRLQALGAIIVEKLERWVVMEVPSKHRFCIISVARADFETNANVWE
jgi:hypothetical protein